MLMNHCSAVLNITLRSVQTMKVIRKFTYASQISDQKFDQKKTVMQPNKRAYSDFCFNYIRCE